MGHVHQHREKIIRHRKRFTSGKRSKAQCPICGLNVMYTSLVVDWRGQYVCPDCKDDPPPPYHVYQDAQQLHHPRPLIDGLDQSVDQLTFPTEAQEES